MTTKRGIVAGARAAWRESSVLAALVVGASCAARPLADEPPAAPLATPAEAPAGAHTSIDWPRATERDLVLAREVVALTRGALRELVPALGPFDALEVRLVVTDGPTRTPSAYVLPLREIRIARAQMNRLNLAHEASHALLHGRLGIDPPVWLDEALAQLAAYRVVHGRPLASPAGRPVSDFAALRALRGASWADRGGTAYGESARWLGYLLPGGPASDAETSAFHDYLARLAAGAADADAALAPIDAPR